VTDDTAFIRLERDLGRLEGVVESLVRGIQMDRESASTQRKELYAYIEASNDRNEKIVKGLSDQISVLLQADRVNERDHARRDGAWDLSRWAFAAMISVVGILFAWAGYYRGTQTIEDTCPATGQPLIRPAK